MLAFAIDQANDKIAELVESDLSLEGMGTTVTGAMFDGTNLGLAHIGDSRAYLLRDGHLERLTHDHTWVQSLVDDGKISESEAAMHPHRSLLLKVLNGQPTNDPDLAMVPVMAGDRLMFCSDGVCGLIADDAIEAALQLPDLNDACRAPHRRIPPSGWDRQHHGDRCRCCGVWRQRRCDRARCRVGRIPSRPTACLARSAPSEDDPRRP